jgi:hypothetical protein
MQGISKAYKELIKNIKLYWGILRASEDKEYKDLLKDIRI